MATGVDTAWTAVESRASEPGDVRSRGSDARFGRMRWCTATSRRISARYLASLDVMAAASDRVADALRGAEEARAVVRRHLAEGGTVSDVERFLEPEPLRASLSDAITELERARHEYATSPCSGSSTRRAGR